MFRRSIYVLGAAALVALAIGLTFPRALATEDTAQQSASRGNCAMCHQGAAQEWAASPHAAAFTSERFQEAVRQEAAALQAAGTAADAAQAKSMAEASCYSCHAPEPVWTKGPETAPDLRADGHPAGVDCLSCHTAGGDGPIVPVFTVSASGAAPHPAEEVPRERMDVMCGSCHAKTGTLAEFRASPPAREGKTCIGCHMPPVTRVIAMGGEPKEATNHTILHSGNLEFLQSAVTFEAAVDDAGVVTAKVTNSGAGHKFPTGMEFRQAALLVIVTDAQGAEAFRHRELFANQTSSGGADTRIDAGDTRTVTVPTGVAGGNFVVRLIHKRMPDIPDDEATMIAEFTKQQ